MAQKTSLSSKPSPALFSATLSVPVSAPATCPTAAPPQSIIILHNSQERSQVPLSHQYITSTEENSPHQTDTHTRTCNSAVVSQNIPSFRSRTTLIPYPLHRPMLTPLIYIHLFAERDATQAVYDYGKDLLTRYRISRYLIYHRSLGEVFNTTAIN